MRALAVVVSGVMVGTMVVAACGGDDLPDPSGAAQQAQLTDRSGDENSTSVEKSGGGESSNETPEPVGPADMDTIRIGSTVWQRTLPMTSGQCFVFEDDGTLPSSAVAWGPLDGADGLRFNASLNQDGTMEAGVQLEDEFWWRAGGGGGGPDDLEVVLDFEALTIIGQGTFQNVHDQETAAGSFAFQCEDDGTGSG